MANSVKLTFGYEGTEFTRQYKFDGIADSVLANVKNNVMDFNDSISGAFGASGTLAAAGLSTFFISDDFDAEEEIGNFTGIVAAQYTSETTTEIDLT